MVFCFSGHVSLKISECCHMLLVFKWQVTVTLMISPFFFYCRKLDLDIIGSIWRIVLFVFQPFLRMLWMMRVGRRKTKKIQTKGFQVSVYFVTFCYEIQRIDLQLSFINYTYVTAKIMKTRDKINIMNIN